MAFPPLRPAVAALLAAGLIAGCAAAGTATAAGGRAPPAGHALGAASRRPPRWGPHPPAARVRRPGCASRGSAGCASWPSGSTRTVLLITAASDGRSYCVRTGQTVRVQLSGSQAIAPGSQPPRLLGNALAAEPGHLPAMPSVSYLAVHPGTAALIIVRLPCRAARPGQNAAAAGIGALARTGTPVGAECEIEQALRVSIIVR